MVWVSTSFRRPITVLTFIAVWWRLQLGKCGGLGECGVEVIVGAMILQWWTGLKPRIMVSWGNARCSYLQVPSISWVGVTLTLCYQEGLQGWWPALGGWQWSCWHSAYIAVRVILIGVYEHLLLISSLIGRTGMWKCGYITLGFRVWVVKGERRGWLSWVDMWKWAHVSDCQTSCAINREDVAMVVQVNTQW